MRVVLATESFLPDVNGVANSVVRMAEHLVRSGHEPMVVAPDSSVSWSPGDLSYPVARVRSLPMPGYPQLRLGLPAPALHAAIRRALAPRGEVLVGFVGRLAAEKEVDLLAGASRLPGVRVVVVGDGPHAASLRRALPDAVFLGARHGSQLARIYASLDVFAHTGPYETFGQAVQEAMASGLPVVAPAAGGPLDLVGHGLTGYLVPPHAGSGFTEAIRELAGDEGLRRSMGAAGRDAVHGRSWQVIGDELIAHYAAALAAPLATRVPAAV
ncbi:glycosyltransferase [Actinoplanes sp. NPDC023714]|uniref:glycosyltransferase n=1 Tax=Actinoplanes sp. NPDC023714 TaxID=3154322 RepID=UPI0033C701C9